MKYIALFLVLILLLIGCTPILNVEYKQEFEMATVQINATTETYVSGRYPTTPYGSSTIVSLGADQPANGYYFRALLRFDLSSIPAGATINSAKLYMHQYDGMANNLTFDAYRVTGAWSDSATWNTQPSYESTPTVTGLVCNTSSGGWRYWSITSLVKELIAQSDDSIMLRSQSESTSSVITWKRFYSSEYSLSSKPYLIITYTVPLPKVNVGDAWKQMTLAKVNVNGTWKSVSSIKVNVGDEWK